MGELIMPKQTSAPIKFFATLDILYDAYVSGDPIVPNTSYKQKIIEMFPEYTYDSDAAMIVKQSELVRYFGFANTDFKKRNIQITEKGIQMYNAYHTNDTDTVLNLIAESIINNTFGRGNTAIKSSDSDIDPPKLFVKAMARLGKVSKDDLAALIALTNDYELDFESAITELTENEKIEIPEVNINKYTDTKFRVFLKEIGFCEVDEADSYVISSVMWDRYGETFTQMSIYNRPPMRMQIVSDDGDLSFEYKTGVFYATPYVTGSSAFNAQNRRKPQKSNAQTGGYLTNPRLAKTAMELADYKCEYDGTHMTFVSKSDKPFMEVHHLIPISAQGDFENNLDCIENLIPLCPNCHSAVHYGNDTTRKAYLKKLYTQREKMLFEAGIFIEFEQLYNKYYK